MSLSKFSRKLGKTNESAKAHNFLFTFQLLCANFASVSSKLCIHSAFFKNESIHLLQRLEAENFPEASIEMQSKYICIDPTCVLEIHLGLFLYPKRNKNVLPAVMVSSAYYYICVVQMCGAEAYHTSKTNIEQKGPQHDMFNARMRRMSKIPRDYH